MNKKPTPVEWLHLNWNKYNLDLGKSGFNMKLQIARQREKNRDLKYKDLLNRILLHCSLDENPAMREEIINFLNKE